MPVLLPLTLQRVQLLPPRRAVLPISQPERIARQDGGVVRRVEAGEVVVLSLTNDDQSERKISPQT